MNTSRSHTPSLVLLGIITLLIPLLLVGSCPVPQVAWHQIYSYNTLQFPTNVVVPPAKPFALVLSGTKLVALWQPFYAGGDWEASPIRFLRQDELIGPFPSFEALHEAIHHAQLFGERSVAGPVVARGPLLQADSWTNRAYLSLLPVPSRQAAGYYVWVERLSYLADPGFALGFLPLYIPR